MHNDVINLPVLLKLCSDKLGNMSVAFKELLAHKEKNGFSALNTASRRGHINVVNMLLTQGAEIYGIQTQAFKAFLTNRNKSGFSSLNSASKEGHTSVVQLLLTTGTTAFKGDNKGFDNFINKKNKAGFTPLDIASWNGHKCVVDLLLAANINPAITQPYYTKERFFSKKTEPRALASVIETEAALNYGTYSHPVSAP